MARLRTDESGAQELVWSGAHLFPGRPVSDFKVSMIDGRPHLSFMLCRDMLGDSHPAGAHIILDAKYRVVRTTLNQNGQGLANMHEFNIVNDGASSLIIHANKRHIEPTSKRPSLMDCWVTDEGFQELDADGTPVFEWWALDHLDPSESTEPSRCGRGIDKPWDFL